MRNISSIIHEYIIVIWSYLLRIPAVLRCSLLFLFIFIVILLENPVGGMLFFSTLLVTFVFMITDFSGKIEWEHAEIIRMHLNETQYIGAIKFSIRTAFS